jgi:DNA polymerase III epsilon subunit family exonuclease
MRSDAAGAKTGPEGVPPPRAEVRSGGTAREYSHGGSPGTSLPEDWRDRQYIALDFETTGLDSHRDRVIEIGLLQFSIGPENLLREETSLSLLVHPSMPIPRQASLVHGIYDLDVSSAPLFEACIGQLETLAGERTIIAHNAAFDIGFLRSEYRRAGLRFRERPSLDSIPLARKAFPGLASYSLGALVLKFGIDRATAHRALDDARSCAALFLLCARRLSA